jgi:hypothetical protein
MYFSRNWDFSSTLSKLLNFVGVPPKHPSVHHYHTVCQEPPLMLRDIYYITSHILRYGCHLHIECLLKTSPVQSVGTVRRMLPEKSSGLHNINIYTNNKQLTTNNNTPEQMAQLNRSLCDSKSLRFPSSQLRSLPTISTFTVSRTTF